VSTPDSDYVTVRAAAKRLKVSPALVYQWCSEGSLPHYRLGGNGKRGKILIDPAELEAFFQARRVDPVPPAHPALGHIRMT
jgi:excisionase family DNA binding protein